MKKSKPIIFLQDCGIFSNEIVVGVGATRKHILCYAWKHGFKKNAAQWLEEKEMYALHEQGNAVTAWSNENHFLLLLEPYEDTWNYWELLIHELHHIVWRIAQAKRMTDESEGQAYLMEYLFRRIRRKLQNVKP